MSAGAPATALYRDVGLIGVGVFTAVTLFMTALGAPADAGPASSASAPLAGSAVEQPAAETSAPTGTTDPSSTQGTTEQAPSSAPSTPQAARAVSPPAGRQSSGSHGNGHGDSQDAGDAHRHGDGTAGARGHGHDDDHGRSDHGQNDHGQNDHGHDDGHDDGHRDHGNYAMGCDDNHPATTALVDALRGTLGTHNVATMIAEGYIPYFDAQIPLNAATEGVGHWLNPAYIDNGSVLDPNRPESILTDEFHRPIGAMFIQDAGVTPPPVYVNDDGTACSPWHPHTDLPATFSWWFYRQVYDGAAYNDGEVMIQDETPAMMHIWIVDNPHGVYAAHDYPPASSREGFPPPMPVPGGQLPMPLSQVWDLIMEEAAIGSETTCPHCPDEE